MKQENEWGKEGAFKSAERVAECGREWVLLDRQRAMTAATAIGQRKRRQSPHSD